ncbi:MAG TPA: hypothetical protein VFN55_14035 [Solirubrobacteraceae bacterium]|nr:hypothetical protein [Solirubrobacteraceae bacterium]
MLLPLVLVSAAAASLIQVADVTLTADRAGQTTGVVAVFSARDPSAPGEKPAAIRRLVITFPAGTRFHFAASKVVTCRRPNAVLRDQFAPGCPPVSRIGTGTATANAAPITSSLKASVHAYAGPGEQIILVLRPTLPAFASQIIVIRATVRRSVLTIPVPAVVLGRSKGFAGVSAVLTSLRLTVPARGSGRSALVTAGRCNAHRFTVRTRLEYAGHVTLEQVSTTACR